MPGVTAGRAAHLALAAYGVAALATGVLLGLRNDAYEPGDPFHAQLIRLGVIAVMSVLAVGLSQYRLDRERRLPPVSKVADAAQRAILQPVPERLGQVRVAVHYESAAREALVGGDMYGFVQTGHGLRVLVGDVRGKGLDAVRLSAQVLATFRERAGDNPDLGTLLSRLDDRAAEVAETDEDFVTAVLVQLTEDGLLTVVNAGHPALILLSGDTVRVLEADPFRPPLGLGGTSGRVTTRVLPHDAVHDDIALVLLEYAPDAGEDREMPARAVASSLG
jgi:phosphoserine phosphatase RsbU/P